MDDFRIEKDSMGDVKVAKDALYGAQTQRAIDNFKISDLMMPRAFIRSMALIKQVSAQTNLDLQLLAPNIAKAIIDASQDIIDGQYDASDAHFPVDVFQTGSGTSSNMNVNEVIAAVASQHANCPIHPNDHVNMSQSSNDVIPTAIHMSAAIAISDDLLPALTHLDACIMSKADSLKAYIKTGRTHLMDAMPVGLNQSLLSWSGQLQHAKRMIELGVNELLMLAQGGTAVGTGVNAHVDFAPVFSQLLAKKTGLDFTPSANKFSLMASQDVAVNVSGNLKTLAVALMKIANDLRWMNSGPLAGLGEISLTALQPGSSIMPGKVNPVIPESVAMVAAQVIGNDTSITIGGQSGNFELNVMLPMIAYNLLQSIGLLSNSMRALADKAIVDFTVNNDKLNEQLSKNPILVTALNPIIGYQKAAHIAKKAYAEKRAIIDVAEEETTLSRAELLVLLDPKKLTLGGI
ncbi:class II fumarate hydratase [Shewanella surugensis]|uniref:Fumarate hydratase class II n=1 Tax=Shewanella surugensis TaxID=212020 RepID=A0ABT0LEZ8_9GAMM|nr:class II fumarate hydratase [Shewanella surugensis]MCL1126269.1 class II fumarate hydratase [Shewanella surugensis]